MPSCVGCAGRVNTAISSAGPRYSRISTGGSCSLTFIRSARSVMLCSEIRFSTSPMRSSREPARSASPSSAGFTPATSASGAATAARTSVPKQPAMNEPMAAAASAGPARPLRAIW